MKFKFSLDPVLKVRKHQEKLQKQKLAEQVAKKQNICNLQQQVQGKLEDYLLNSEKSQVENIHMIRNRGVHVEMVHQKINRLSDEIDKAEVEVSEELEKLAIAHKKLHILEKVKEFEFNSFSDHVAKEEQKLMDEFATQAFSR